jgi:hypothetical protein
MLQEGLPGHIHRSGGICLRHLGETSAHTGNGVRKGVRVDSRCHESRQHLRARLSARGQRNQRVRPSSPGQHQRLFGHARSGHYRIGQKGMSLSTWEETSWLAERVTSIREGMTRPTTPSSANHTVREDTERHYFPAAAQPSGRAPPTKALGLHWWSMDRTLCNRRQAAPRLASASIEEGTVVSTEGRYICEGEA